MFECGTCGKGFVAGWQARDNHCFSTGHACPDFECDSCDEYFDNNYVRSMHMQRWGHCIVSKFECNICPERFESVTLCKSHEVNEHHHCRDCDRDFISLNNIKQHLNSRIHRGTDMTCPFCHHTFATATGVTHHLEQGSCPKARNVNRDELYRFVRAKDPEGRISKKLIGWHGSSGYEVTGDAWNGAAWECYFCHREFKLCSGLNQHLNSPVHQQKLYHCPSPSCCKEFTSLAAIINHLESESCAFMRFERVQKSFGDIMAPGRRLQF